MRVTFVTPGLVWAPGGSYGVIFEYANELVARGHSVCVVFPSRLPAIVRSSTGFGTLRAELISARRQLRRRIGWFELAPTVETVFPRGLVPHQIPDGDTVIATSWTVAKDVAAFPPRKGGKLYLVHHYEGKKYPPKLIDSTLRLPMPKVAVSRATYQELAGRGVEPLAYIPNGVNPSTYRIVEPLETRGFRIGMNYVPKEIKDPGTGIDALSMVRDSHRDVEAVLFGASRRPRHLPSWIEYVRHPSTEQLVTEVYNRCSIFLCSSRLEGFGLPAAEAMACGCALVTTDCGGVRDFAEHGTTALLSPPGDPAALAENLARAIEDPGLRVRLSHAGHRKVGEFTWTRSAALLEQLMGQLNVGRRPS